MIIQARIVSASQRFIPTSLRTRPLYLAHYTALDDHPGDRKLYETLRREYSWPQVVNDAYTTVADCQSFPAHGTATRHQKQLGLFPAARRLELLAMDILGALQKMISGYQHVTVLTIRYTKLKRDIPVTTVASTSATAVLVYNWDISYNIPTYLLTYNSPKFFSKFFAAVTARLEIKHHRTTAYQTQTKSQMEPLSKTIVARL